MGYDLKLVEESLKLKVAKDFFNKFDTTDITDNIDFMVADSNANKRNKKEYYLWAEAKRGNKADIYASIVQLILTIGKAEMKRSNLLPPHYFGAFDAEKIAFLPNYKITSVFSQNDFNWNVTPSDHETKEFKQIYEIAKDILEKESLIFYFDKNKAQLKEFIKNNFVRGNVNTYKIQITKNNFKNVYYDWLESVKPTISIDWENEKPEILDTDFYIADLLSRNNNTEEIRENIRILLKGDYYKVKVNREKEKDLFSEFHFTDGQKAHLSFWNNYERPPKEEVQDYIIYRRDELVPQDIRERKGAYFTPRIWVKKAQEYLAQALGENYQDEYYFWDCAAGSGNLLVGLNDKYRIFVSTLDKSAGGQVKMFPQMQAESDNAYKIKNEEPILVIMGNPPYNSKSEEINRKDWILEKLKDYKENLNEKNINLEDDYIKFIRFAHWKMEKIKKGIIDIIVNNSFINGLTHREMRRKLMQTFDEIYILDLHSDVNKGEKCPDGSTDFNIFNIKEVDVCIAFFVKTGGRKIKKSLRGLKKSELKSTVGEQFQK